VSNSGHVEHRTYQSKSRECATSGGSSGIAFLSMKYPAGLSNHQVNTTGAMGLANVVKGNLGSFFSR
jgi:hypothetical protein